MSAKIDQEFFARDTVRVARDLLGVKLIYQDCEGIIAETEAYRDDPASHAVTKPNKGSMLWETYGHIYIFFIYGMYHCLNFTTEKQDEKISSNNKTGRTSVLLLMYSNSPIFNHKIASRCSPLEP
jgi:3-methyladenine DNA glycosylase Mpg